MVVRWIDVGDEAHLWSARFDAAYDDAPEFQYEIAVAIAEAIREELEIEDAPGFLSDKRYRTSDVRAWERVQRAFDLVHAGTPEAWSRVRDLMREAIALDPDYAEAHAVLALTSKGEEGNRA